MQGAQKFKSDLEQAKIELEAARRSGNLGRMSELQYGRVPELERKIREQEETLR